jgi:Vitamin K-dependent gamma-carboxylase
MNEVRVLGIIRILIGAIFLLRTTPLLWLFPGLVAHHGGPLLGWPRPGFHIGLFGVVIPTLIIKGLVILRSVAAFSFMVGFRARIAGIIAVIAGYLVYSQEPFAFIFTLHTLYVSTLLLACTDAPSSYAIVPSPVRNPQSSITLIRAFVVSIYAWSAIAKLRTSWLSGRVLSLLYQDRIVEGFLANLTVSTPLRAQLSAIAVVVLEASLGPLLLARPTRPVGIALACTMHAVFELTVHPDVFGWVMVALLLCYVPYLPTRNTQRSITH